MAGVKSNPQDAASKWQSGLANSTQRIADRVAAVTESPGAKAAAASDRYLQGVQRNAEKFKRNVGAVSTDDWKRATIEKGVPRIASGASAAQPKMESFMAELLPHVDAGSRKVAGMPKGTIEDSKARAVAFIDHMSRFRRSGR